jgi:hypothetical protein
LSKQAAPINEINLGDLKSTQGNQVYDLNSIPDFDEYKFISIHCVSFNSLFGSAKFNTQLTILGNAQSATGSAAISRVAEILVFDSILPVDDALVLSTNINSKYAIY